MIGWMKQLMKIFILLMRMMEFKLMFRTKNNYERRQNNIHIKEEEEAPRSAHARPSAQPVINMSGNFLAHVTFKHLPQPLRSHI